MTCVATACEEQAQARHEMLMRFWVSLLQAAAAEAKRKAEEEKNRQEEEAKAVSAVICVLITLE